MYDVPTVIPSKRPNKIEQRQRAEPWDGEVRWENVARVSLVLPGFSEWHPATARASHHRRYVGWFGIAVVLPLPVPLVPLPGAATADALRAGPVLHGATPDAQQSHAGRGRTFEPVCGAQDRKNGAQVWPEMRPPR
jgi:hypothetical protein